MFVIRQGCLLNYCFGGSYVSTCGVELKEEIIEYLQHIIYWNPVFFRCHNVLAFWLCNMLLDPCFFLTWCYWLLMLTKVKVPWPVRICWSFLFIAIASSTVKRCYGFWGAQASLERKRKTLFPHNSRLVLGCHLRRSCQTFIFLVEVVLRGLVGRLKKATHGFDARIPYLVWLSGFVILSFPPKRFSFNLKGCCIVFQYPKLPGKLLMSHPGIPIAPTSHLYSNPPGASQKSTENEGHLLPGTGRCIRHALGRCRDGHGASRFSHGSNKVFQIVNAMSKNPDR